MRVERHDAPPAGWARLADDLGSVYHHPAWIEGVGDCFNYRIHCLTASDDGGLAGGLALAEVPSLFGRARLVSYPFSFVAGPMSRSEEVATLLYEAAIDIAKERGLKRVEIKHQTNRAPLAGFERSTRYLTYRINTGDGEEAVWSRLHKTSTQQRIRKGEKAGVVVVDGKTEEDWLQMAILEERVMRRHGVPAPPRRFFVTFMRSLQEEGVADLYLARIPAGKTVAGFVMLKGSRNWIYANSASDPAYVATYRPTHVLLWEGLKRATATGVTLDLGRTAPEQATLADFKRRWGAEEVQLSYDYWPNAGGLNQARRDRGLMAAAAKTWSLLPHPITRWGSALYRYLG